MIEYIISLRNNNIDQSVIDKFNNCKIYLNGERLERFLNHLNMLINFRLSNSYNTFVNEINIDKINFNTFNSKFYVILDEIEIAKQLSCIKLIPDDYKDDFQIKIAKQINNLIDEIANKIHNNQILNYINSLYIQL